jgi:hypothetical protein
MRGNRQNLRGGRGYLRRQQLGGNAYRLGLGQVRRQLQQRNPNDNGGFIDGGRQQNNQRQQQQQMRQGGGQGGRINRVSITLKFLDGRNLIEEESAKIFEIN